MILLGIKEAKMYSFAQLSKDMEYLAYVLLLVCGLGFAGLFVTTTVEEKALFTSILQSAGITMLFVCLGAILMKLDDSRKRWMGIVPAIFGTLVVLLEANYYFLEEFNKEHNFIGYLLSGNHLVAGEIIAYAPWAGLFIAVGCLYSIARSKKVKRV